MNQLKFISPQAKIIYELLLKNSTMTSKEIGARLNILPNAVYRAMKPLISLGFVQELGKYPVEFGVTSSDQALDSYLLKTREVFLEKFFPNGVENGKGVKGLLNISFIKDRPELLERSSEDIDKAQKEVSHIVSGLEVPAETILTFNQALQRGVKLRFLIQRLDEINREMLKNWQKMGMEVRYFPLLEARIIIIDSKIVYITSYSPKVKNEAVGVRFDYPPIARIMNEVFKSRWEKSEKIR